MARYNRSLNNMMSKRDKLFDKFDQFTNANLIELNLFNVIRGYVQDQIWCKIVWEIRDNINGVRDGFIKEIRHTLNEK